MIRPALILLCAAALALSACAKVGTLDQPAPLFGEKAKAKWAADQAQKKADAEAAKQKGDGEPEPLSPPQ